MGARSIGTARTADKIERAKALGLDDGVVPKDGRFADAVMKLTGGAGVDVVLELVGGAYVAEDLGCIALKARILLVGMIAGPRVDFDLGTLMRRRAQLRGTMLRARPLEEKIAAMRAVVDRVLPLAQAAEAHAAMASNEGFGKMVLEV
jgi:NADPH:quinone reductase-like Zn-dependent oxidoreductase